MPETTPHPDPLLNPLLEQLRDTLIHVLPLVVEQAIERPNRRRKELVDKLLQHLTLRRLTLHKLRQSDIPGQGTLAASLFEAELARVCFVEGQVAHLNEQALLYTLGVFAVDGRPGDYVMPWTPTPKAPADRD